MKNVSFLCICICLMQACSQPSVKNTGSAGSYDYLYHNLPFEMQRVEEPVFPANNVDIAAYGGVPDGITLNTGAFAEALDVLSGKGGGTLSVSKGIWLTGPITLQSNINLHLEEGAVLLFTKDLEQYPVISTNYEGRAAQRCQAPVSAKGATNIAITGKGVIDGSGEAWRPVKKMKMTENQWKALLASGGTLNAKGDIWSPSEKERFRPVMISLQECNKVLLEGVTFQNSPAWNIHPLMCRNLTVRDIAVRNPWYSQNGDGIDLESCAGVVVTGSTFDVGDDGICIKSGKDEEGRKRGIPCENILVDNCIVYHGHGGFVVGSEMSGGVRNIKVSNCTFLGTDVGLRFKSTRGRGGVVENIHISNIAMLNIPTEPLLFDLFYGGSSPIPDGDEPAKDGKAETVNFPVNEGTPQFKDIYISNVTCNGAARAMFFNGLPEMNVSNIHINDISITAERGAEISRSDGVELTNVKIRAAKGAALILRNAKNINVENFVFDVAGSEKVNVAGSESKNIRITKSGVGKNDIIVDKTADAGQVDISD
ncbi:MAG: glycoside hydrolase family 28 protein [Bacteroidales bacterium]|jgi:polygalacturonase|nr:glycoside hydrolase family 28 protein [Bacteroidales bacterium]